MWVGVELGKVKERCEVGPVRIINNVANSVGCAELATIVLNRFYYQGSSTHELSLGKARRIRHLLDETEWDPGNPPTNARKKERKINKNSQQAAAQFLGSETVAETRNLPNSNFKASAQQLGKRPRGF